MPAIAHRPYATSAPTAASSTQPSACSDESAAARASARARVRALREPATSITRHRPQNARLDPEERLEHLQRRGRSRLPAEAPVLDQRADDDVGVVHRSPAAPPRLVDQAPEIGVPLLGGARLAGDRHGEAAEDAD